MHEGLAGLSSPGPANEETGETTIRKLEFVLPPHMMGWEESPQCLDVHPSAWREMFLAAVWVSVPLTFGKGGGVHPKMKMICVFMKKGRGKSQANPQRTQPPAELTNQWPGVSPPGSDDLGSNLDSNLSYMWPWISSQLSAHPSPVKGWYEKSSSWSNCYKK